MDETGEVGRRVVVEIGSDHREIRIVRLVASGVASLTGADLEAVEDLRIAVDEACVWLIDRGDGGRLRVEFSLSADGALEVTGETGVGASPGNNGLSELVEQILRASCTEHHFETSATSARFALLARLPIVAEDGG